VGGWHTRSCEGAICVPQKAAPKLGGQGAKGMIKKTSEGPPTDRVVNGGMGVRFRVATPARRPEPQNCCRRSIRLADIADVKPFCR